MKKLIALLVLVCIAALGYSQENSRKDVSVFKETMAGIGNAYANGEVLETMSEFSYGFFKQFYDSAEGLYHSVKELPDACRELMDVGDSFSDYIEFGWNYSKYLGKTTIESIENTVQNVASGDAEKIGAATSDVVSTIVGGKVTSKLGKVTASRYGTAYHYTTIDAANSIAKEGIKIGKSGRWFATYDPTLSTVEARKLLALPPENFPTARIAIKRNGLIPEKIRTVKEKYNQPGGGMEQLYEKGIGADNIISIEQIDMNPTFATKATRFAGESTNYYAGMALIDDAQVNNPSEGGHKLHAKIHIVVITKDSVKPGGFKLFDMDDTRFVLINSADIDKLTHQFYRKVSGDDGDYDFEDEDLPSDRNRSREEAIPMERRTQRGL